VEVSRTRRAQLRIGSRFEKEKVETMSVAFTREESAETAAEVELPDRPISPHRRLPCHQERGPHQGGLQRPLTASAGYSLGERRLFVHTPTGILLELVFREGNAASNSQRSDQHA
jgi:hypothetical protein